MATEEHANEEKILVSVRVRPLNDKEKAKNEVSDWKCFHNTVMYNNNSQADRPSSPPAYVFGNFYTHNALSSSSAFCEVVSFSSP